MRLDPITNPVGQGRDRALSSNKQTTGRGGARPDDRGDLRRPALGGATLNGHSLWVSGTAEPIRALLGTGFPCERDRLPAALELFGCFATSTQSMRRLGSAALDLCYAAAGSSTATTIGERRSLRAQRRLRGTRGQVHPLLHRAGATRLLR